MAKSGDRNLEEGHGADCGSPDTRRCPYAENVTLDFCEVTCFTVSALAAKVALEAGTASSKEMILAKGGDGARYVCLSVRMSPLICRIGSSRNLGRTPNE